MLQGDSEQELSSRAVEEAAVENKADIPPVQEQQSSPTKKSVNQKTPIRSSERDQLKSLRDDTPSSWGRFASPVLKTCTDDGLKSDDSPHETPESKKKLEDRHSCPRTGTNSWV
ncbi:hypothetical protein Aduo_001943 [Ancylostoma duodenale]